MSMNYVKQLNAFGQKSIGVLDAKEQAMYLRLFLICNQLRRPEWFEVANSQLMRETGIGSKVTIIAIRKRLEEKGFIKTKSSIGRKKTKYKLPLLYAEELNGTENEPLGTSTVQKINGTKNERYKNQTVNGTENEPLDGSNGTKNEPYIKEKKDTKNISLEREREGIDTDLKETIQIYEHKICIVPSPRDLERLADNMDHYGKELLLKAIDRADRRGGRSMGYIEGILRNWEQNGYDEEGSKNHGTRSNRQRTTSTGRKMRFDQEAERKKWENETSGWD